jgi:hypothetical protein
MELQEKYREGLYDPEHKPRLSFARNYLLQYTINKGIDFTELTELYKEWRDYDEYMVLQEQTKNLRIQGETDKKTIAVKCAKRGNDVYWSRVWKRLKPINNLKEHTLFDTYSNVKKSNVLFMTLTYDIKRSTIQEAWETVGEEFNNWIRNLRNKFGRISYLRCWEASRKGYPHIHVLMVFHTHQFRIAFSQLKKGRRVYRIEEKESFEKAYHSFVDVQAIRKMREGIKYITKYLSKTQSEVQSQMLTLALCWLFKKRSFAVSGAFHEAIYTITNIQYRVVQIDLFSHEIKLRTKWILIGIFSASKLGIDHNEWRKVIVDREILNEVLG